MPRFLACAAPLALSALCPCVPAQAQDALSLGEDGLEIELADGAIEIELGGKLQYDTYGFDLADESVTSGDFRRVRPDLRIRIADKVSVRAEWEFSGSQGWRNLYAQIEPLDGLTLRGGNFIVPFSMEDLQSSASVPFAERSLASAISPSYGLGGQLGYSGRRFTLKAGYFGQALDSVENRAPAIGEGIVARATWLALDNKNTKLHLGIGGEHRELSDNDSVRFSATAGTSFASPILRSRRFNGLTSRNSLNAEVGIIHRNFTFQGQYLTQWLDSDINAGARAKGGYLQAAWMPTGHQYRYSQGGGTISGPRLSKGKMPALELAARYSAITVREDGSPPLSAEAFDLSAGLHLTAYAKILLNGTLGWSNGASGSDDDLESVTLRFQLAF